MRFLYKIIQIFIFSLIIGCSSFFPLSSDQNSLPNNIKFFEKIKSIQFNSQAFRDSNMTVSLTIEEKSQYYYTKVALIGALDDKYIGKTYDGKYIYYYKKDVENYKKVKGVLDEYLKNDYGFYLNIPSDFSFYDITNHNNVSGKTLKSTISIKQTILEENTFKIIVTNDFGNEEIYLFHSLMLADLVRSGVLDNPYYGNYRVWGDFLQRGTIKLTDGSSENIPVYVVPILCYYSNFGIMLFKSDM